MKELLDPTPFPSLHVSQTTLISCMDLLAEFCCMARGLLEEILDDDEELAQLNLSSRPAREDRQRARERDRLKRGSEWCVSSPGSRVISLQGPGWGN